MVVRCQSAVPSSACTRRCQGGCVEPLATCTHMRPGVSTLHAQALFPPPSCTFLTLSCSHGSRLAHNWAVCSLFTGARCAGGPTRVTSMGTCIPRWHKRHSCMQAGCLSACCSACSGPMRRGGMAWHGRATRAAPPRRRRARRRRPWGTPPGAAPSRARWALCGPAGKSP